MKLKQLLFFWVICSSLKIFGNIKSPHFHLGLEKKSTNDSLHINSSKPHKLIYNAFQFSYSIKSSVEEINEIKFGLFLKNNSFLSGLSCGFQSVVTKNDTAKFKIHQVPLYFSNMFILNIEKSRISPFFRFEVGALLGENVFSRSGETSYRQNLNSIKNTNMLFNVSLGAILVKFNEHAGFTAELGYKYNPTRISPNPSNDILFFAAGLVF